MLPTREEIAELAGEICRRALNPSGDDHSILTQVDALRLALDALHLQHLLLKSADQLSRPPEPTHPWTCRREPP